MTPAMLEAARWGAQALGLEHVEFREGTIEDLPVESASADVVISNGVISLCHDKVGAMREAARVLKPGGGRRSWTSWCTGRCRRRRKMTSTSGPVESPAPC